jgi:hypothetical protein
MLAALQGFQPSIHRRPPGNPLLLPLAVTSPVPQGLYRNIAPSRGILGISAGHPYPKQAALRQSAAMFVTSLTRHQELKRGRAEDQIDATGRNCHLSAVGILNEVASPRARRIFHHLLPLKQRQDGSYRFSVQHMKLLAACFPLAFGQDPPFYNKASLLFITMEIALSQLGAAAAARTPPPSDYRIPQILEGLGIPQFGPRHTARLARGLVFALKAREVPPCAAAVEAA